MTEYLIPRPRKVRLYRAVLRMSGPICGSYLATRLVEALDPDDPPAGWVKAYKAVEGRGTIRGVYAYNPDEACEQAEYLARLKFLGMTCRILKLTREED